VQLVYIDGAMLERAGDAEHWARLAEAILTRLGPGHERFQAWLFNNRGSSRLQNGDLKAGEADLAEAVRLKEKIEGRDHPDVAQSLVSLAEVHARSGNFQTALTEIDRALEIFDRSYGPGGTQSATALINRCEYLNSMGRHSDALESCRAALSAIETTLGKDHQWSAYALTGTGIALISLGRADEALPNLRRALDLRERLEPKVDLRAETRFALARGLWETGDRPAGRAAAAAARAEYDKFPKDVRKRDAVDVWLAAHLVQPARARR